MMIILFEFCLAAIFFKILSGLVRTPSFTISFKIDGTCRNLTEL
jgi:hypothetical protein